MKSLPLFLLLSLCAASLAAQTPTAPANQTPAAPAAVAPPTAQVHTSDLGISYSIPSDWDVVDAQPMLPAVKQQAEMNATSEDEKKGVSCVQVVLLARHGNPGSVIEVIEMPFDCFGQQFTDKELPSLATGVAAGIQKSFLISAPTYGAYSRGAHSLWIERASGTLLANPYFKRTIETVCGILKKGVVCWVGLTADDAALQTFEQGAVSLEGEAPVALVPPDALNKKP